VIINIQREILIYDTYINNKYQETKCQIGEFLRRTKWISISCL